MGVAAFDGGLADMPFSVFPCRYTTCEVNLSKKGAITTAEYPPSPNMRISLSKDQSAQPGEILAHVHVSASDDLTKLAYSHSFRYKVPSEKDGVILVYADKESASKDVEGDVFPFDLEKCRNKDCKAKNPNGCPVIAGKGKRLLVADVFHTMPTQNTLQYFGTALFKALFSRDAGRILEETKSTHGNGPIFLLLNDQDLDAIPWEYAKDGMTFLVHTRKFARVIATSEYDERPPDRLPKLPLRVVVAAPDPLDLTELKLADLHLGDQVQNFINEFREDSIKIMLERVLPATVNKMNSLLAKHNDEMATVFHFMGHCVAHKDNKARGLLFEDGETFQCEIAHTQNLVTIPTNLRLAFLSACDSREVARDLAQNGVRYTIGSNCPLPDDIARKSEAQFYRFLAQGLPINEAMWRTRMYFQHNKEPRQSDYLAGAMILYSTTFQTANNTFLCESGQLIIEWNMFPNNINNIPLPKQFFGRKRQLTDLNGILRRMVTRTNDSFDVCTITGIGGQGKTTLAREVIHRIGHFFPGGTFVWRFDNEPEISAGDYLRGLAKVLFPNNALNDVDEMEKLGQDISNRFQASCLLILDHADIMKRAAAEAKEGAVFLVKWLQRNISRRDIAVKILATSQEDLGWPREILFQLDGFTHSDIHSGCKLFVENLPFEAKVEMKKEENSKHLLRELVESVDGHPLTLKLLGSIVSLPEYRNKSLKDIREHYSTMLADVNRTDKSLEDCFGPMIDGLPKVQRQMLYLCCLFTGPITDGVLLFVSHFLDHSADDFGAENIKAQLPILCRRGLLKSMTKNNLYSIQIVLQEAIRQRNTELSLRLCLQPSGDYADVFVIGVLTCSSPRKSRVLQWLFHNIKSNHAKDLRTKSFGIEYYSLENTGWTIISFLANTLPTQLIVFIYRAFGTSRYGVNGLHEDQISFIVTEKNLPFILCSDRTNADDSAIKMKKAAKTLRARLVNTHQIVITDVPSEAASELQTILTKTDNPYNKMTSRVYQKSLADVNMEGKFIGRENELAKLHMLLNDDTHQYITIKGFGGMGKTCLAIQAAKNFNSGNILALSLIGIPSLSSVIRKIAQFLGIENKELEPQEQQIEVIKRLGGAEIIVLYLDNMEDIKNAMDRGNSEAKDLMRFFRRMPKNVKILATSRVTLGWPDEEIVELYGLTPPDGMKVFWQWSSQRKNDIDNSSAMMLSNLVNGHSLSLRLLGGVFDNCDEPMDEFLDNVRDRLSTAVETGSATERHESINACIEYSFGNLDSALRSHLGQLKPFEIPFCKTIAVRALSLDAVSSSASLIANNLHKLWQRSWLNRRIYQEDPMLGDWRPRAIENDTKFYSLHPRLRDFLDEKFQNVEDANSAMSNDCEIQFYTALCYGIGFGVVNNLDKQIEWCKKAANNGHLEAQLILALCYELGGGGVGEDQYEASYWYLKAAKVGDKGAQQEMSRRFYLGWRFKEVEYERKYWRKLCNDNRTEPLKIKFDFSLPLVHRAAEYGVMDLVRSLMEQRLAKVEIKDGYGRTPLHVAAEKGRTDIFQLLALEFGANINVTTKDGRIPLHLAAENGHSDIVRLLVAELGADINANAKDNMTPLHLAAENGHSNVVRLLVAELGADVNAKDKDGGTPFHRAARAGHVEVMKVLEVGFGVDINVKDEKGQTPVHWALRSGQIGAVKFLIAKLDPKELNFQGMLYGMSKSDKDVGDSIQLTCAYLLDNSIGDSGARVLGEPLKQNTTLTELNLEYNNIGAEGARALGESLMQNTTLTQLNLRGNGIGNEGARALGESLKQNATLTQLNLEYNGIGNEGARALSESLKQNTTLTQLNLEGNNIADIRNMRISLVKDDPTLTLDKTLVHVEVYEADDPPTYSHSFKYKVPSGTNEKGKLFGEIIIYTNKNASGAVSFPFELEECRNKDCKKEDCPVAKPNRVLVADVFHTKPKWLALQEFGVALFKALFSGYAGQLRQKTEPPHPNGRIYLQLNSHVDLDAIPWEYANNRTKFLVHQRIFTRIQACPRNMLPKYPLRIVAVVPDPVVPPGEPGADLPDLHLNEQFRNFIDGFTKNKKAVKLERVFPPTIQQMEPQLMKERETATVLHFMGHCVQKGTDGPRALIFEHNDNGGLDYVDAPRLVSTSDNLRLAFISACNSRDIARVLVEHGIPYVIGSNFSIPDNLARKFEQEFYKFLTGGSTVEKAMHQARVSLWNLDDIRRSYFAGAMVLYSSIFGEDDGVFECEDGDPNIQRHEPPNNLTELPTALSFYGHRKELSKLYTDLKRMVERGTRVSHVYTVKGTKGQKFVAEAMKRMAHLFPGGIFVWRFDEQKTSALGYFQRLVDVIFLPEVGSRLKEESGNDDEKLGSAIIQQFSNHATCLLVLDQADILDLGRKGGNIHAGKLGNWLGKVKSMDTVKILLISQKPLDWLKGELMDLNDSTNPIIIDRRNCDSYFEYYEAGKYFYGVPGENLGFVDRPELIQNMQDALNTSFPSGGCRILVLKGLGGVGKTQLMLRYCYLRAAEYDIFWLTVDSWNTAVQAYYKMAGYLGLDEAVIKEKGSEQKVINWVLSWFAGRTKWLLLLDNADGEMSKRIFELIPRKGGNIIFTTRQPIPLTRAMVISVDKMQVQEALLLLYGVSSMDSIDQKSANYNSAQEIIAELDCLPLAIILARAYVRKTGTSFKDYFSKFKKEHKKVLEYRDKTDSDQYEYTFATVWQLSFERIKAQNPATMQILEVCAFLRPENIPASLFKKHYAALELKLPVSAISPNEQDEEFSQIIEEAITMLADYSFVSKMKINDVLAIHRLVQKVIYDSMIHEQKLDWVRKIVAALCTETYIEASRESYNRKFMEVYVPHIRHLVALINESDWKPFSSERLHVLLYQVLHYLTVNDEQGFGDEELLQTLVKGTEKVFGAEHEYSLVSLSELANHYMNIGKYSIAEAHFRKVLAIYAKTPKESSKDLVVAFNNLALICERQGNLKEAEFFYLRILVISENSEFRALISSNLGELYVSLGNYDKAEEYHKRTLTIRENELGRDNVTTAESLNNLAVLYEIRGNYGESEKLQRRALAIRERELGQENTNTATSMSNLAVILMIQGKYIEAELLFQKALVTFKIVCGPAHPRTATRLCHLAALYQSQGKFEEAMPISQEALNIRKKVLGPEHPDTAQSLNNLGNIYNGLGKYDEAEKLYNQALAIYEKVLGSEHADTATPLVSLASLYKYQKKPDKAESLYNQALAIREKTLGSEHPDTATALHGLASLYNDQRKYDEAEPLYQRALAIREKALVLEHPATATVLQGLASLYKDQSKYDEAESLYQRALAIREKALGLEHQATATVLCALNNIADIYSNQKMYDNAKLLYKQVAGLYRRQGRNDEAERLDNQVLAMHGKALGSEHSIKPRFRFSLMSVFLIMIIFIVYFIKMYM